jgi:uroporphyrin-III C-methyltransferase
MIMQVGDPFLFGRGGEEVLFYRSHGFEARVLPGLASALAAPVLAGIPLTHRGCSNQVLIATGRDKGGALPSLPPFDPKRTLVLLMAVGRLPTLATDLGALGFPADTPVAVIERSTHPDERVTRATLGGIAEAALRVGVRSPAVLVIGQCLDVLTAATGGGAACAGI